MYKECGCVPMFQPSDWKVILQSEEVLESELPAFGVPVLLTDMDGNVALVTCIWINSKHYFWLPFNASCYDAEFQFNGKPIMYLPIGKIPLPNGATIHP